LKRRVLFLLLVVCLFSISIYGQKIKPHPCDSLKAQFDQALGVLDSLIGSQNQVDIQRDSLQLEFSKIKTEISSLIGDKHNTKILLEQAKKLIAEQMEQIKNLEAEVKRLSAPGKSPNKKGV
jgi:uncharacterized protein (DUF3084 family)